MRFHSSLLTVRRIFSILLLGSIIFIAACGGDNGPAFLVESVVVIADNPNFTGTCPHDYRLTATITTNSGGPITFFWERINGVNSAQQTIIIPQRGSIVVTDTLTVTSSGTITVRNKVLSPNQIDSNQVTLTTVCQ